MFDITSVISLLFSYFLIFSLLFFLSEDAKRHNIYLSFTFKIIFILFVPIPLIWYFIKRIKTKKITDNKNENNNEIKENNFSNTKTTNEYTQTEYRGKNDIMLNDSWLCGNCGVSNESYLINCKNCKKEQHL